LRKRCTAHRKGVTIGIRAEPSLQGRSKDIGDRLQSGLQYFWLQGTGKVMVKEIDKWSLTRIELRIRGLVLELIEM